MSYTPKVQLLECLNNLEHGSILSEDETDAQWDLLKDTFPFGREGTVEWGSVNKKVFLHNHVSHIKATLEQLLGKAADSEVYIQWSDSELPIVKTNLDAALKIFNQLAQVTTEFFIFNPTQRYLVEVLDAKNSTKKITAGLAR